MANELYPDQQETVKECLHYLVEKDYRSIILCGKTGSGKTVMAADLANTFVKREKVVLMISDRVELHDGFIKAASSHGMFPFLIDADNSTLNIAHNCYISMSQTLKRRIKKPQYREWLLNFVDVIFIDECHKEEFNLFFTEKLFCKQKIIGLSATPRRFGSQRQLFEDYQHIVFAMETQDLIAIERLAKPIYIYDEALKIDTKLIKVRKIRGEYDFDEQDAAKVMRMANVGNNAVDLYKANVPGQKFINFSSGSADTIRHCVEFNEAGIPSKYFISETKEKEAMVLHEKYRDLYSGNRKDIIKAHKAKEFLGLFNNNIFTTGYDDPLIEVVIIQRLTMNPNLLNQMIGRGSRFVKGIKEQFTIIDLSDNIKRLGKWHMPYPYSLHHKKAGGGLPILKKCPHCEGYNYATVKICKLISPKTKNVCNFVYPEYEKLPIQVNITVESYDDLVYKDFIAKRHMMSWDEINRYREVKNFRLEWLYIQAKQTNRENEFMNTEFYKKMTA